MGLNNITAALTDGVKRASRLAAAWAIIGETTGQGVLITIDYPTISVGLSDEVPVGEIKTRTV